MMKLYTSPTVLVVLNLAGRRVPSGNWMRIVTVGCDSSIAGTLFDVPEADVVGVEAVASIELEASPAPGTGLPSRRPSPLKGLYCFGWGSYGPRCCMSLTSTGVLYGTFIRCSGALPCRIRLRSALCAGSSYRINSPSSMLKPSSQMCSTRLWGSTSAGRSPAGSGMLTLSWPSPPKVWPAPENREVLGPASDASDPGRRVFLVEGVSMVAYSEVWLYSRLGLCEDVLEKLLRSTILLGVLNSEP